MYNLKYILNYPPKLQESVLKMIQENSLDKYLLSKYPKKHSIQTDKELYRYIQELKNLYLKKSKPISKIKYDNKIHILNDALGTHTYISRVQGGKLKAKNEIKIASVFKSTPIEFLKMIVVHELAHIKEKEHNKSFYKLCEYMENSYHQYEFDMRVYLIYIDMKGKLY
jgi:predicted metal-dependent hydrolase